MTGDVPGGPAVKALSSSAVRSSLIPGGGSKIPNALQSEHQNIKQKQYCKKFNKDFKNGPDQKKIFKKKKKDHDSAVNFSRI